MRELSVNVVNYIGWCNIETFGDCFKIIFSVYCLYYTPFILVKKEHWTQKSMEFDKTAEVFKLIRVYIPTFSTKIDIHKIVRFIMKC